MREEAIEAVGPKRAVTTPLTHVVNRQQRILVCKEFDQADFAFPGCKTVVWNLGARALLQKRPEFPGKFKYLFLKFGDSLCGHLTCFPAH